MRVLIAPIFLLAASGAALAQTVPPFPADDCSPGYTADGRFIDARGEIFEEVDWRALDMGVVMNAEGRRVLLSEACLTAVAPSEGGETGLGGGGIGVLLGALVLGGLASGGGSSTNGTN